MTKLSNLKKQTVLLLGNPNAGKTTLLNALTHNQYDIGNWCGVTVGEQRGVLKTDSAIIEIVDLPGCYDLTANARTTLDQRITQDFLATQPADLVLNVVDASHLERDLHLTLQLLEKGFPVLVALNGMDKVRKKSIEIVVETLWQQLGCPVVPMAVKWGEGVELLKKAILDYEKPPATAFVRPTVSPRQIISASTSVVGASSKNWTAKIDTVVLHPFWGIPIFLGLMYLMFGTAMQFSGFFQGYFELGARTVFIDGVKTGLLWFHAPSWLIQLIAFGVGQGLTILAGFIPVMITIFFCIVLLEISGYMARAAFVMDKVMQWFGLPGKSFVPMIIGFGCNVPAVMATRTLDNERERILTVLMTPFMSCGARLAIYALFVSSFFKEGGHYIVFALYFIGILVALLTAFVLKGAIVQQKSLPSRMELPKYEWPRFRVLCKISYKRLKHFLTNAGTLIIPLCMIIALLGIVPDEAGNRWLATLGRALTPIFEPMGIQANNWPATVGLMTGVMAKEAVVGTLTALYSGVGGVAQSMVVSFGSKAAAFSYLLFVLLYFPCVSVIATIARELNGRWALFSALWTTGIAYIVAVFFYQTAVFADQPRLSSFWLSGLTGVLVVGLWAVRSRMLQKLRHKALKPLSTRVVISNP